MAPGEIEAQSETRPTPESVFTPRAPAGELMFVSRTGDRVGERVDNALNEMGSQLVIYGSTGVGKTSLVSAIGGQQVARVECLGGKSFLDLLNDAFGALGAVRELSVSEHDTSGSEASAGVGLGWIASIRADIRRGSQSGEVRDFAVYQRPVVDALLDALAAGERRILFFDNFENVQTRTVRRQIAELMTAFSDRSLETANTKIVVAGIADAASGLVSGSGAAGRRIINVHISPMPDDEISEILTRGMALLSIKIAPDIVAELTRLCCGYPYVAHLLGLHAARIAPARSEDVTDDIADEAVRLAVADFQLDFDSRYARAKERSGSVRPRQILLHAMAESEERELPFGDIVELYRDKFGLVTNYTFLNQAIGRLLDSQYGELLSYNNGFYSFTNPLARSYVRMVERAGDVPWEDNRRS